ncbi:6-phosphofructokinase [Gracilimonas sp. Q87]|uniref:6-phosphofructokinase n=1 Tax=Gracilimonas sp. Q87 TaxID=3384766 RepID=UPI003984547C
MKKALIATGGGDCPGLNAVIRAIVKRAEVAGNWEVHGSIEAFNGALRDPREIMKLNDDNVGGIHAKGGTILKTTNKGGPFSWPVQKDDGSWDTVDRSDDLVKFLNDEGYDAVINIGGDGSQRISQALFEKGVNIIGVPKTIDNDLSCTDYTFGFQTAVDIATDAVDKLVTTAESHHRLMILEVMGRGAGWIALHAAIAGGAEVCLIPEIPYDVNKVVERLNKRYNEGKGFAIIVIAEGAKAKDGTVVSRKSDETGYSNPRLGGIAYQLSEELKNAGFKNDIREMVLGHLQRGGTPIAFDRILATQFGVKAMEMAMEGDFGKMVSFLDNEITSVSLKTATKGQNLVDPESFLVNTAKGVGISFGD